MLLTALLCCGEWNSLILGDRFREHLRDVENVELNSTPHVHPIQTHGAGKEQELEKKQRLGDLLENRFKC